MAERKDKDPVFGRLDDLDDISSLPLGLRNGGPAHSRPVPPSIPGGRKEREDTLQPGPAISVVSSLTTRTQSAPAELDEAAPGHPGAAMRHMRERLGLDKADLAARTRLSRRIIDDLEANRFDSMPPAYVRGYLRTVARELGGDAGGWIRSYEGMGFAEPVLKATVHRNASSRWGLSGGIWGLMVGAILVSALGLGVYAWTEGDGASPLAGLTAWFGEVRQRFAATAPEAAPEALPEPGAPVSPALAEPAEEVQWLEAPEPSGRVSDALALDAGPVAPEPAPLDSELSDQGPVSPAPPFEQAPAPAPSEMPGVERRLPAAVTAEPPVSEPAGIASSSLRDQIDPEPEAPLGPAPEAARVAGSSVPSPDQASSADASAIGDRSALSLSFDGTSWIEVRSASDGVALRGIFHAGDVRSVVVEMPARVILGNAPAVRLSQDGRPVGLETHTREDRTARFTLGAD